MLDTKTSVPLKKDLEMYPIDFNNFISHYHDTLTQYLVNNHCLNEFNENLALSSDLKELQIGSLDNNAIAQKSRGRAIKQNGDTISQWADHILRNYANILQNRIDKQSKMDFTALARLLTNDASKAMFSRHSYINWILANYHLHENGALPEINYAYVFKRNALTNYQYIATYINNKLVAKGTIKASTINAICTMLDGYHRVTTSNIFANPYDVANSQLLINQLCDFIEQDKVIYDSEMEYSTLIRSVVLSNKNLLKLPLNAIFDMNYNSDITKQKFVLFEARNKGLNEFINSLINKGSLWLYYDSIQEVVNKIHVKFQLSQNSLELLDLYIEQLSNTFKNIKNMQWLKKMLILIKENLV